MNQKGDSTVDENRDEGLRMCPSCRDWLDDEEWPVADEVCRMCAKATP